jgi:hypothetical protein
MVCELCGPGCRLPPIRMLRLATGQSGNPRRQDECKELLISRRQLHRMNAVNRTLSSLRWPEAARSPSCLGSDYLWLRHSFAPANLIYDDSEGATGSVLTMAPSTL